MKIISISIYYQPKHLDYVRRKAGMDWPVFSKYLGVGRTTLLAWNAESSSPRFSEWLKVHGDLIKLARPESWPPKEVKE